MTAIRPASFTPPPVTEAKLRQSAEDFTTTALNELLQPMFDSVDTSNGMFGGGAVEQQFKPMMIQEFARQIAHQGGLGLEEPVYQQMLRLQEQRR